MTRDGERDRETERVGRRVVRVCPTQPVVGGAARPRASSPTVVRATGHRPCICCDHARQSRQGHDR